MSKAWHDFQSIRQGIVDGPREGYTPSIFLEMDSTELSAATQDLLKDISRGDNYSFSIQALPIILGESAIAWLEDELLRIENNPNLPNHVKDLRKVEVCGTLATTTKSQNHIDSLLEKIRSNIPEILKHAVFYLKSLTDHLGNRKEFISTSISLCDDERSRLRLEALIDKINIKSTPSTNVT